MFEFLTQFQNRNFLRLWLAQLISQFGDRMTQLALIKLAAERSPGSAFELAKLIAFTILPVFIIQPIAGVLVDRWDRRRTLFVCDLIRGAIVLLIPTIFIFWESLIPIYIIIFLVFCFSRFYVPAKMSIIPDLVSENNLLKANSLVTTTGMIAFVIGCAMGGFLIERFGARAGFVVDAITYLVSALFVFTIKLPKINRKQIMETSRRIMDLRKSVMAEIKEGLIYLVNNKDIRFIIGMLFTLLAAAGAVYVVIIVFVQETFQSSTSDLGFLAVCLGVGLFMGVLIYGRWGKKIVWFKTIFLCLITGGLMLTLFATIVARYPNLIVAVGLSFLLGVIIGPIFIASNTIVHFVSDAKMRGKVFSALEIVIHFAFLLTMLLSSWISQFISSQMILVIVGLAIAFVGIFSWLQVRRNQNLVFADKEMV